MLRRIEKFLRDHLILIIIATLVVTLGIVSLALASRDSEKEEGGSLPAVEIKTKAPYEGEGIISAVDAKAGTVSIKSKKMGTVFTITTDENTIIKRNHSPAAFSDLAVGDKIEVYYYQSNGNLATKIEAKQSPKTGQSQKDKPSQKSGDASKEKRKVVPPPVNVRDDDWNDDDDDHYRYAPSKPQKKQREPSHIEESKSPYYEDYDNYDKDDKDEDHKAHKEKEHQDKKDNGDDHSKSHENHDDD